LGLKQPGKEAFIADVIFPGFFTVEPKKKKRGTWLVELKRGDTETSALVHFLIANTPRNDILKNQVVEKGG